MVKTDEALAHLKRSISSLVVLRARDNLPLVRETGRRQTAEFVGTWLMRSYADGKDFAVTVSFEGEPESPRSRLDGWPLE
jgi:hypothetical protein